jgi:hypothetical protein
MVRAGENIPLTSTFLVSGTAAGSAVLLTALGDMFAPEVDGWKKELERRGTMTWGRPE